MKYHRIAARLYNCPLFLAPHIAETLSDVLATRMGFEPTFNVELPTDQGRAKAFFDDEEDSTPSDRKLYKMIDDVAVVPVLGELVNRGSWMDSLSGMTSYMSIRNAVTQAVADDAVRGIVLDVDSGGGEASGALETGAFIRQASKSKSIIASVDGMAASAAYAIASGADKIVTSPSSALGSIGVVTLHIDRTAQLDKQGLKPTLITSGEFKADYSSAQPLAPGARDRIQELNNVLYGLFANTVAGHRGMDVQAVFDTKAGIMLGEAGIQAGLADRIGDLGTAVSMIPESKTPARTFFPGASLMSTTAETVTKADHEAALAAMTAGHAAALSEARKAAAVTERTRISAILDDKEAEGRTGLARHLAFKTDMTPEAAIDMLKASDKAPAAPAATAAAEAGAGRLHAEMAALAQPHLTHGGGGTAADPYAGMTADEKAFLSAQETARKLLGKPAAKAA